MIRHLLLWFLLLTTGGSCRADSGEIYRAHPIHQPRLLNYIKGMVIRSGDTLTVEDCDPGMKHRKVTVLIGGRRVGSGSNLDYISLSGYVTQVKLNLDAVSPGRHTLFIYNAQGKKVFYTVRVEK